MSAAERLRILDRLDAAYRSGRASGFSFPADQAILRQLEAERACKTWPGEGKDHGVLLAVRTPAAQGRLGPGRRLRVSQHNLPMPKRIRAVVAEVADERGVALDAILSTARCLPIAHARFDAMRRAKRAAPLASLPQIGGWFGRDHTSVMHALRRAEELWGDIA